MISDAWYRESVYRHHCRVGKTLGPHHNNNGNRFAKRNRTIILRLREHEDIGPSGVFDQSVSLIMAVISPPKKDPYRLLDCRSGWLVLQASNESPASAEFAHCQYQLITAFLQR